MDVLAELLNRICQTPETFCAARTTETYNQLLNLYEEVGFGPPPGADRDRWREDSIRAWSIFDNLVPGSTTVGKHKDALISSWGTLPISSNLLYTHSVCMVKTLPAAVTLMAQALTSISLFDRIPEMDYLATGYSYESRFTTQFQRPLKFRIPDQIESESLLCSPALRGSSTAAQSVSIAQFKIEDAVMLTEVHRWLFDSFSKPFPALKALHNIQQLSLRSVSDEGLLALLLVHDGPSFLTAADVHRETLVFPVSDRLAIDQICHALRSTHEFREKALYFFLRPSANSPSEIEGEMLDRSFWIATPRSQSSLLRRSYVDAFTVLLWKYSSADVGEYLSSLKN